ncbi:phosphoribosylformimino-5-aminoimidazole carboxamide ribotide isomerase [Cladophialophora bantiana CBS 173.52]|uniref:Phosphoribosylformimino-5-aminoimidazole carboxamide ribotide isomerase n=1 Tax=Cladophialophora bantiana (strain ATCC 10958 / CBS 173.52 / CDC B-1940 / NIH 8579) TaxID=1442370 RepID=A0A0D2HYC6_CLAB1|nr:phosphoribosylformimino-5-aminoimidazole carboxamide ribotide isomerase [Cladophialophora bantiana CBS 173.52]KIW98423.1 phosphoribosylformimino-5-aminoimidazole carboxamide ribotide isomerase [Cladophialophora bantiana CBS 173.52]
MTRFRPCIDLHAGQVKQIVGGTLSAQESELKTNYISQHPAEYFAHLYRDASLLGAHIIMLGPGNEQAAKEALAIWPGRLQVGGGITDANAKEWIEAGAEKVSRRDPFAVIVIVFILAFVPDRGSPSIRVIITSFLFPHGRFSLERLKSVLAVLADDRDKLVIDLSCRRSGNTWFVAMNKWQTITEMEITKESIKMLEPYCSEFLIHAADNEGLQQGIDTELVKRLSDWCTIPVTYAGGARAVGDLDLVKQCSQGKVDLTIGSALDIFGGSGARFEECIRWNAENA